MTKEKKTGISGGIQALVDELQEVVAIPVSALPEIAESDTLRAAAERVQKSQRDFFQTIKDTYQLTTLSMEEREQLLQEIASARAELEAAEEQVRIARSALKGAALTATAAGMSNTYVAKLAGVPRQTVIEWRRRQEDEPSAGDPDSDSDSEPESKSETGPESE